MIDHETELIKKLESEPFKINAAMICFEGEKGIMLRVGENLTKNYLSGDFIVFWEHGEQSVFDYNAELEILNDNLWDK